MSPDPSRDAELYEAFQEAAQIILDECACCGKRINDSKYIMSAVGFCSVDCSQKHAKAQREKDNLYAAELAYTEALISSHNFGCPKCRSSKRYCPHLG